MSTVVPPILAELELRFEDLPEPIIESVQFQPEELPLVPGPFFEVSGRDIAELVDLFGPLTDISWRLSVVLEPAVIPLPASAWLLAGALAVLYHRSRPAASEVIPLADGAPSKRRGAG